MPRLIDAMNEYLKTLEAEVLEKVDNLERIGWEVYQAGGLGPRVSG
jgi:phosphoribosylaminoimidazole carboxylase